MWWQRSIILRVTSWICDKLSRISPAPRLLHPTEPHKLREESEVSLERRVELRKCFLAFLVVLECCSVALMPTGRRTWVRGVRRVVASSLFGGRLRSCCSKKQWSVVLSSWWSELFSVIYACIRLGFQSELADLRAMCSITVAACH